MRTNSGCFYGSITIFKELLQYTFEVQYQLKIAHILFQFFKWNQLAQQMFFCYLDSNVETELREISNFFKSKISIFRFWNEFTYSTMNGNSWWPLLEDFSTDSAENEYSFAHSSRDSNCYFTVGLV